MTDDPTAISRFLSYVLRHHPDEIGLQLDAAGWVDVDTLLTTLAAHGRPTTRATLEHLASTGKRRLEIRGHRVRAAQGHSIDVDLGLEAVAPPPVLYHGTIARNASRIRVEGLSPRGRTHVHLSADPQTATTVGARRGEPVILVVDAAGMHAAGFVFYRAANGVWLTERVPPEWLADRRSRATTVGS